MAAVSSPRGSEDPGERLSRFPDTDQPSVDLRFVTVGMSTRRRILVVVHAEEGDTVRIISARRATPHERRFYEEG